MKKLTSLLIISLVILNLTGCKAGETAKQTFSTVVDEIGEAYENIVAKISSTGEWIDTKVTQTKETVDNVQEAANEVDEAMESIKELTGQEEEMEAPADGTTNEDNA